MPVLALGADVVAGVDRAQPDAAGHRRRDPGVVEVEAAAFGGAVADHGALELLDQRGLGVESWRAIESWPSSVR